jgi:hypothetical protein
MNADTGSLGQEWIALQSQHEQYERSSLLVKLFAVLLWAIGFALALHELLIGFLLLVLWLQEGILRTSQARLGARLLRLERALRDADGQAFQLHSEWLASRQGFLGLLFEYAGHAIRPTVAYPYAPLLLLMGLLVMLAGR